MFCVTESLTVGFKNYLISAEKSENTVEKYIRDLRHFAAFLKGEVTREKVLAYKKELCEDYAPASVNSMLSSLNAFFDFAGRIDLKVKTLKISRRIFTDSERELKKSEYERLLLAAKEKKNERLLPFNADDGRHGDQSFRASVHHMRGGGKGKGDRIA